MLEAVTCLDYGILVESNQRCYNQEILYDFLRRVQRFSVSGLAETLSGLAETLSRNFRDQNSGQNMVGGAVSTVMVR